MYLKDTLNAVGGVDFTKNAQITIIKYVKWSKIGEVFNLSKTKFTNKVLHALF